MHCAQAQLQIDIKPAHHQSFHPTLLDTKTKQADEYALTEHLITRKVLTLEVLAQQPHQSSAPKPALALV